MLTLTQLLIRAQHLDKRQADVFITAVQPQHLNCFGVPESRWPVFVKCKLYTDGLLMVLTVHLHLVAGKVVSAWSLKAPQALIPYATALGRWDAYAARFILAGLLEGLSHL